MNENVKKISDSAIHKIKTATREELENDLINVVTALVEAIGESEPRLLDENTPEDKLPKLFFTMITSIAGDFILPFKRKELQKRFDKVVALHPILQKYSKV